MAFFIYIRDRQTEPLEGEARILLDSRPFSVISKRSKGCACRVTIICTGHSLKFVYFHADVNVLHLFVICSVHVVDYYGNPATRLFDAPEAVCNLGWLVNYHFQSGITRFIYSIIVWSRDCKLLRLFILIQDCGFLGKNLSLKMF